MTSEPQPGLERSVAWLRIVAIVLGLLLVGSLGYSFWAITDQGVTIAYHDAELERLQKAGGVLERVAMRITATTTRSQLLAIVREVDSLAFERDGAVIAGSLAFYFDRSGTLACIEGFVPHCEAFAPPDMR